MEVSLHRDKNDKYKIRITKFVFIFSKLSVSRSAAQLAVRYSIFALPGYLFLIQLRPDDYTYRFPVG